MKESDEEKILDQIRKRVLEEYKKREQAKEIELQSEANIEALHEVTGLPKDEIQKIADQVRQEAKATTKKESPKEHSDPKQRAFKKKYLLAPIAIIAFFMFMFDGPPGFRGRHGMMGPRGGRMEMPGGFFGKSSMSREIPNQQQAPAIPEATQPPADTTVKELTKGFCSVPQSYKDYRHCDLDRDDFKNADLTGSNFDGVDLAKAHFENCNLTGASFKGANLKRAVFKQSQLAGNDFTGADMDRVQFVKSNLTKVNLTATHMERANFKGIRLHEVTMKGAELEKANFQGANLNQVDFSNTHLEEANFNQAYLNQVDFTNADLEEVDLSRATLNQVTQ